MADVGELGRMRLGSNGWWFWCRHDVDIVQREIGRRGRTRGVPEVRRTACGRRCSTWFKGSGGRERRGCRHLCYVAMERNKCTKREGEPSDQLVEKHDVVTMHRAERRCSGHTCKEQEGERGCASSLFGGWQGLCIKEGSEECPSNENVTSSHNGGDQGLAKQDLVGREDRGRQRVVHSSVEGHRGVMARLRGLTCPIASSSSLG